MAEASSPWNRQRDEGDAHGRTVDVRSRFDEGKAITMSQTRAQAAALATPTLRVGVAASAALCLAAGGIALSSAPAAAADGDAGEISHRVLGTAGDHQKGSDGKEIENKTVFGGQSVAYEIIVDTDEDLEGSLEDGSELRLKDALPAGMTVDAKSVDLYDLSESDEAEAGDKEFLVDQDEALKEAPSVDDDGALIVDFDPEWLSDHSKFAVTFTAETADDASSGEDGLVNIADLIVDPEAEDSDDNGEDGEEGSEEEADDS